MMRTSIKKLALTFIIVSSVFILFWAFHATERNKNPTNVPKFYSELANKLSELDLKYLCFYKLEATENVAFYFDMHRNKYDDYSSNDCLLDLLQIKEEIESHINSNTNSDRDYPRVSVHISLLPGEWLKLYNYDFTNEENDYILCEEKLSFYENIYVDDISALKFINDAVVLKVSAMRIDEIEVFESFKKIQYLSIQSSDLKVEDKLYLQESLPNCLIICNGIELE